MQKSRARLILPYVVGLAFAIVAYSYAGQIEYTPRAGELGPEVWPRLALLLMGASCLFEIMRRLLVNDKDATGLIEALDREPHEENRDRLLPDCW